jgi:hypothetical protein
MASPRDIPANQMPGARLHRAWDASTTLGAIVAAGVIEVIGKTP